MKVKYDFFDRGSFHVGNGEDTPFGEDTWLQIPICIQQISTYLDVFTWELISIGYFTIISLYLDNMNNHTRFPRRYTLKIKNH
jgi:hypothetical protein